MNSTISTINKLSFSKKKERCFRETNSLWNVPMTPLNGMRCFSLDWQPVMFLIVFCCSLTIHHHSYRAISSVSHTLSAEEMCLVYVLVYPRPHYQHCYSAFEFATTSDWLDEAYDAGYWDVNTSDGKNISDLINDGTINRAGDLPPALWSAVGGKWHSNKPAAAEMFEKLLHDPNYDRRASYCGVSRTKSTFEDTLGDFKEYCSNPCGSGCDSDSDSQKAPDRHSLITTTTLICSILVASLVMVLLVFCPKSRKCFRSPSSVLFKLTGCLSSRSQVTTRRFFQWLGMRIHSKPCWFIAAGALLTALCSFSGFFYYRQFCDDGACIETRSSDLWNPQQSEVWSQYTEIIDTFGTYPSVLTLLLTANDDESILLPTAMDMAFEISSTINDITLYDHNGRDHEYSDLCTRSSSFQSDCDSFDDTFFALFFRNNNSKWSNINHTLSIINPPVVHWSQSQNIVENLESLPLEDFEYILRMMTIPQYPTAVFLGSLQYSDPANIISAQSLQIHYSLEGSSNKQVQDAVYEYAGVWNEYWSTHHDDYDELMTITYNSWRLLDDEVSRTVSEDIPVLGAVVLSMVIYLMFTLGKMSCIGARPWLALSAVIIWLGAIIIGFSISLCFGTKLNSIVFLAPFILLGVGMDDMS